MKLGRIEIEFITNTVDGIRTGQLRTKAVREDGEIREAETDIACDSKLKSFLEINGEEIDCMMGDQVAYLAMSPEEVGTDRVRR